MICVTDNGEATCAIASFDCVKNRIINTMTMHVSDRKLDKYIYFMQTIISNQI